MKVIFTLFVLISALQICSAQTSNVPTWVYRVSFTDKKGTLSFSDSSQFLTQRSLNRRTRQGILLDSADLPIPQNYITTVMQVSQAFRLHCKSKWMNSIVIMVTDTANIGAVKNLSYVNAVELVAYYGTGFARIKPKEQDLTDIKNKTYISEYAHQKRKRGFYGAAYGQINQLNLIPLHDSGFKGKDITIAVLDADFYRADTMRCFDSLWQKNKILDTANIARPRRFTDVYTHGTDVFSTMGAYNPGTFVGTAPEANYALYVTEDAIPEQPIEMDNWITGAERADSIGADIINSSLGYKDWDALFITNNVVNSDLNGHTTLIAKGLNAAAQRGIIVVQATGNWGGNSTKELWTPSDADSSFSIGMVDTFNNYGYGSRFGPTADGRIKPDVMGQGSGVWLVTGDGTPGKTNGTSFSSPLLAGSIACLWQALPCLPAWEIKKIVRQSSTLYNTPNDSMGYGIPDFNLAWQIGKSLCVLNIDEPEDIASIKIFPIPTEKKLSIVNYKPNKNFVKIYDLTGRILLEESFYIKKDFDLSSLNAGQYFIEIFYDGKKTIKKIIRQ